MHLIACKLLIDLFIIHDRYLYSSRHSSAGGNPDRYNTRLEGMTTPKNLALPATRNLYDKLDSRLRGNDEVVNFG